MKPLLRKITQESGYSFSLQIESPPLFDTPWHFHPEYELILIEGSRGKRFMGDNIDDFSEHELLLIGKNLPHFWKVDHDVSPEISKAYVIHFSEDFLGEAFFSLPESHNIKHILQLSLQGLKITGKTNATIIKRIKTLVNAKNLERLLGLQHILHIISESNEFTLLANKGFIDTHDIRGDERMNKVYGYTMTNFVQKITLAEIASIAAMSEIAFCRYFKKRTGKSYFDFLNGIRIGYSCRLLIESQISINEICYESGFNSLSHFNRLFKRINTITPKDYRTQYATTKF